MMLTSFLCSLSALHRGYPGCGFVVFGSKAAAESAIHNVADKVKLPGALRGLILRYAGPRPEEAGA